MATQNDLYDVIVVGGGPAGTTTAALVAETGRRVLLLERERFPRFKIGESLIPGTYHPLKRLGMIEKMRMSSFPKKYSVQFFGRSGKASRPFYFNETDPSEASQTWQVTRGDFDKLLIENAAEKGVEVWQETSVHEPIFDGDRAVGVRAKRADGEIVNLHATVIVDATGQSALFSRKMKIGKMDPYLKKAAIFTHYKGAHRDEGIDEGATLVINTSDKESWFWYIPLPDDRVSVGVVSSIDYLLQNRDGELQTIYNEEVAKCVPLQERIANAEQMFPVKTTKDFSYRSTQISGHGWVLVGDAFGFLDPIYSSGVYLALQSGEWGADAIIEAFENNDFSPEQLGKFGARHVEGMEAFRKLVYAFYDKDFSFSEFLTRYPQCHQGVVDILSGYVYTDNVKQVFGPLSEMLELPEEITL